MNKNELLKLGIRSMFSGLILAGIPTNTSKADSINNTNPETGLRRLEVNEGREMVQVVNCDAKQKSGFYDVEIPTADLMGFSPIVLARKKDLKEDIRWMDVARMGAETVIYVDPKIHYGFDEISQSQVRFTFACKD